MIIAVSNTPILIDVIGGLGGPIPPGMQHEGWNLLSDSRQDRPSLAGKQTGNYFYNEKILLVLKFIYDKKDTSCGCSFFMFTDHSSIRSAIVLIYNETTVLI